MYKVITERAGLRKGTILIDLEDKFEAENQYEWLVNKLILIKNQLLKEYYNQDVN